MSGFGCPSCGGDVFGIRTERVGLVWHKDCWARHYDDLHRHPHGLLGEIRDLEARVDRLEGSAPEITDEMVRRAQEAYKGRTLLPGDASVFYMFDMRRALEAALSVPREETA